MSNNEQQNKSIYKVYTGQNNNEQQGKIGMKLCSWHA